MNPKGCILLVDDEEVVLDIGMMMIEKLGYKALGARSSAEAVRIYKEKGKDIDIVLLDLNMPVEGGGETFKKIREIDPVAKVILSTGSVETEEVLELKKLGCRGMLQKPFGLKALAEKIGLALS
jgi:CheY-like chemotaxis protein